MKRHGLLTDRKVLVDALEQITGQKATYCGAPTFRYTVGKYSVLRDGSLKCEEPDEDVLERLAADGLIEAPTEVPEGISFPTDGFTGRTLVNLVNCIAARQKLINKAIDRPNAFHMSAELVRTLKKENPLTVSAFMDVLHSCGGENAMRGLRLVGGSVVFTGFPDTEVCRQLAERMVNAALTQGWIKPKAKETENEKYSFRVWLNALGMKGEDYKEARAELLKNFEGDAAFRTEDQRKAFYEGRRKRPVKQEPEFILL